MPEQNVNRNKQILQASNELFMAYDAFLTVNCLILSLVFIGNRCICLMFVTYGVFYAIQTLQHYLIYIFPKIDINKHHVAYRRIVITILLTTTGYMFLSVTFWQKSQWHPIYCALCVQSKYGLWVGLFIDLHCIFLIGWGIALIHSYITRRYYLLALGGFQVQQRILEQRGRQLNEILIIEPDTNHYPIKITKQKYYKFEDVAQVDEQNYQCTICMDNQVQDDHFVNAGCGHYYHQICLIQWAQFNSNCPQCRKKFQEEKQDQQKQNEEVNEQEHEQRIDQSSIDNQAKQIQQNLIRNNRKETKKKIQVQIQLVSIKKQQKQPKQSEKKNGVQIIIQNS